MTTDLQPSLFAEPGTETPQLSPARVRALAGVLTGFVWPGARPTAKQQARAESIAHEMLARFSLEPE